MAESIQEQRGKVSYAEVREQIRDGDVILFCAHSLLGRIIRLFTGSRYSHAGLAVRWNERLMLLEATGKGLITVPLSWRVATYPGESYWFTTDDGKLDQEGLVLDRRRVMDAGMLELGKEYAAWLLVRIARRILLRIKKRELDPLRPPAKLICSQYVSIAYKAGGVDLAAEADAFTTPEDIGRSAYLVGRGQLSTDKSGLEARYSG